MFELLCLEFLEIRIEKKGDYGKYSTLFVNTVCSDAAFDCSSTFIHSTLLGIK